MDPDLNNQPSLKLSQVSVTVQILLFVAGLFTGYAAILFILNVLAVFNWPVRLGLVYVLVLFFMIVAIPLSCLIWAFIFLGIARGELFGSQKWGIYQAVVPFFIFVLSVLYFWIYLGFIIPSF